MDILLGKLGNQPFPLTESSISRRHAFFHLDDKTGKMTLRDEQSKNGTYIKTKDGSFKRLYGECAVTLNTVVRLGAKHTFMIKDLIKQAPPPQAEDISNLRNVYEIYNSNKMDIEAKTSNIMMLRIGSMSISTMLVNVIIMVLPKGLIPDDITKGLVMFVGSILALSVSWVLVDMKNKSLIQRREQNERFFKKKYCCPKCGFHFGPRIYDNILAEGICPNKSCKCKFTGK